MKEQNSQETLLELTVQLCDGGEMSSDDLDDMTRLLKDEIEQYPGAEQVRLKPADNAPIAGAKTGAEVFALGALMVAVLPKAIPTLIGFLQEWTLRPGNRPVKIKSQIGDRCVEVEFDPRVTGKDEVASLVREIQALIQPRSAS
ncbi:MAG: hypothetical protein ACRESZ_16980 [Methylococcales bacterium]